MISKDVPHQLYPHQIAQQGVDGYHLEKQEGPGHEHHNITAGEVIQEVLWEKQCGVCKPTCV